jgi:hypothetical protein
VGRRQRNRVHIVEQVSGLRTFLGRPNPSGDSTWRTGHCAAIALLSFGSEESVCCSDSSWPPGVVKRSHRRPSLRPPGTVPRRLRTPADARPRRASMEGPRTFTSTPRCRRRMPQRPDRMTDSCTT